MKYSGGFLVIFIGMVALAKAGDITTKEINIIERSSTQHNQGGASCIPAVVININDDFYMNIRRIKSW